MKKSFYFFTLLCASFFVSAQSNLLAGDIAFIGSNTSIGGQFADQVSFILLKDITASTKIIFTDKGWSDSEQKLIDMPGDGEYEWVADGNMDAGTVVTLDLSIDTGNLGSFNAFAIQGDQLFAIQGTTDNPSFIAGLHFNIKKNLNNDPITIITDDLNWDGEPSIDNQGNPIRNDESALPDNLVTGDTAIRLFYNDSNLEIESNNFQFSCEKAGEDVKGCKEELRKILHNSDNWDTNNSVGFSNLNESACPITLTNELTVTGLTGNNKIYDGTTYAIATGTAVLSGVNPEDDVFLGGSPVFTFASSSVGTGVVIITSGYTLSGQDAENYKLTQPTLSGDITAKELTITGITGSDKVYDGTTAATATGMATLNGVEAGDDVILGGSPVFTFASDNVGTGITINTSGYTISGTDSGNYTLTQPTLSGDITAKELTITGITGSDKVYDDTTAATATGTFTLNGVAAGDDVFLGGSPVFTFASANVGTGITINTTGLTISGTDSANYTLTQPTLSGDITAKELTITGITGDNKVIDCLPNATVTGTASILGVISDDDILLGGNPAFMFVSVQVGADITINTIGYTISGTDSGNYTLTQPMLSADILVPSAMCQDIEVALNDSGQITILPIDIDNESYIDCGWSLKSVSPNTFFCNDIGTNIVTLTIGDENGNISTCQSTVTVFDNVAPTVTVNQDIIAELDDNGTVIIKNLRDVVPVVSTSDNCEVKSIFIKGGKKNRTFTCNDIATNPNIRIIRVKDVNGNKTDIPVNIIVQDNIDPIPLANDIVVQLDDNGVVSVNPNDLDNGSSDNCEIASFNLTKSNFTCNDIGNNVVTFSVTDVNGNKANTLVNIKVKDNTGPTVTVNQDIIAELDKNGTVIIKNLRDVVPVVSASDNCEVKSIFIKGGKKNRTFTCNDIATNPNIRIIRVKDVNGNKTDIPVNIIVQDNIDPIPLANDIVVQLDDNGVVSVNPNDLDNGSSDNCEIASFNLTKSNFTCNDIGNNVVTFSVTDVNGNKANTLVNIKVKDNTGPTVTVNQDIIAELDKNGTVIIKNLRDVVPVVSASDNCEVKSIFIKGGKKNRTFTCNDIATNPNIRIIRVKDVNGNKTDIPVNIIVQDNIDPIPLANDIVVQLDDNGIVSVNPNDLDNGSSDNCEIGSFNLSKSDFTCNDIGNNGVTFSVTDVNGNTANTLVNIEVIGIELDYEYQDVTCFGLDDGMITLNYITPGAIVTVNNEIYDPNKLYPAGTYNIKAFYDSDNTTNCVVEESIEILEPENVTFDVTTTAVTCSGEIDGTITVSNLSAGAVYTIKKNGIGEDLSNQIYFEPGFYVVRAFLPVAANNDDLFDDIFYDNTCEATAFAVVFEDNNCSDRTNSLNAIDVSVYPNPVKDILNIRFDNDVIDSDITIEVHNLVGNKMYSNTFSSKAMVQPEIKINFSKFPSHVYYVNIITQQGSVIKKIILDR